MFSQISNVHHFRPAYNPLVCPDWDSPSSLIGPIQTGMQLITLQDWYILDWEQRSLRLNEERLEAKKKKINQERQTSRENSREHGKPGCEVLSVGVAVTAL